MSSRELIEIKQHVPLRVLEQWIKHHDGPAGVLQRLLFIRLRYKGESVASAAESVSVTTQTGYNWQEWWNVDGLAGLIPKYAGGHPSRLSPKQKEGLLECLNEQDHWTTGEVQQQGPGLAYPTAGIRSGASSNHSVCDRRILTNASIAGKLMPNRTSRKIRRMSRHTLIGIFEGLPSSNNGQHRAALVV